MDNLPDLVYPIFLTVFLVMGIVIFMRDQYWRK